MYWQPCTFEQLGAAFYTRLPPTPLPQPHWIARSRAVADWLELPLEALDSEELLHALSGNRYPDNALPIASVYSGHQFGVWAGQLGDGRALLLGERATNHGRYEVQLKGAGRTPYSRMGDGRAVLRSSIREFLASEAMHALGIPTTRALCVTGSPQPVRRETIETAAVTTRVAPSFIRFGHFEHFAHHGQHQALRQLADFVIAHHYPECLAHDEAPGARYAALLAQVSQRTAELMAQWQAVGFCHGVMNTDNMSILGLTLDYGPFQFMDGFDPGHICNHSDERGRYAYARQPNVAYWNLFCLAQALLPLLDDQQQALDALEPYKTQFPDALQQQMNRKLGLTEARADDPALTETLLQSLARERVDYTIFWRRLSHAAAQPLTPEADRTAPTLLSELFIDPTDFNAWWQRWRQRSAAEANWTPQAQSERMLRANPHIVLRNHLAETAISNTQQGDTAYLERLLAALETPFQQHEGDQDLAAFPPDWAAHIAISCSS